LKSGREIVDKNASGTLRFSVVASDRALADAGGARQRDCARARPLREWVRAAALIADGGERAMGIPSRCIQEMNP
jgi:hypothetical protein